MGPLNYHHLYYFWTVAKSGTIAKASKELQLTQPTISEQLRSLESSLDTKLFQRAGRNLVLTENGRKVFRYAEQIFVLGRELTDSLQGDTTARAPRLRIGIADSIPELIAAYFVETARKANRRATLVCEMDRLEVLLSKLGIRELDFVVSNAAPSPTVRLQATTHALGKSGMSFLAVHAVAGKYRAGFPRSLNGAPLLRSEPDFVRKAAIEAWFSAQGIRPVIAAELPSVEIGWELGAAGAGVFLAPTAFERIITRRYGLEVVGRADDIAERFFLISNERKLANPAAMAVVTQARNLFSR